MNTADIRRRFLEFFKAEGHTIVPSSPLVPAGDPTLLFTNSGMVQFKDVLLGLEQRPYQRAVTAQRCLRAGGKHNDLENVGYTARHHTFFEMLGNFSFGDYFKRDAIRLAWQLLTEGYHLPADKLWVTVYQEDDEAYDLWKDMIGVAPEKIIRIGDNKGARYASDNFWQMADIGPCGPCSEIFYDHGEEIAGGPPGSADAEGDRYIEIWNLVFMQFNRDENGILHPLPRPSVDTGMGLERIAAVLQGLHSNYDIDIFQRLIQVAGHETQCQNLSSPSLKVLADHIRACSFMIVDGVIPGNEGRSYVLRRIIRRAIRHGYKLGARTPFFHRLVAPLTAEMGAAYPELAQAQHRVEDILEQEEARFFSTIEHGMMILDDEIASLMAHTASKTPLVLEGRVAFKLHDTYGFPLDLTADVCRERGIQVDEIAFDKAMAKQKMQAREAGKFKVSLGLDYQGSKTVFHGYCRLEGEATILALYRDGAAVSQLNEGEEGTVILDHTPFYAESGGQVGDQGTLQSSAGIFSVTDTQKVQPEVYGHYGVVTMGYLRVNEPLRARVDEKTRMQTMRHHSATHLMHSALRSVLGEHVQQKGSQVDAEKTRFDFSHSKPVRIEQIREVEKRVNEEILNNLPTEAKIMPLQAAKQSGAMMLFDEKYGDEVRVLTIGGSKELCGGTHVERTGDIGFFKIVAESGVAAGVRRVEAVSGSLAMASIQEQDHTLGALAGLLKTSRIGIVDKVQHLLDEQASLQQDIRHFQQKEVRQQAAMLRQHIKHAGALHYLVAEIPCTDLETMRGLVDALREDFRTQEAAFAVILGCRQPDKAILMVGFTPALSVKIKAGDVVRVAALVLGGKGGGRSDFAQAGGGHVENLQEALQTAERLVLQKNISS